MMDANDVLAGLNIDHVYSWLYVFGIYFRNVFPFLVFVPRKFFGTTVIVAGLLAACHIGLHFSRFLANKKKVSERRARFFRNLAELYNSTVEMDVKRIKQAKLTELSLEEMTAKIKDGSVDKKMLLNAFRLKAHETAKFKAVSEFIMSSTLVPAPSEDGDNSDTNNFLNGIPVSISEAFEMNGKDRTLGFGEFVDIPGQVDAVVVKALKAAGAVPCLRTNVAQGHPLSNIGLASSNPIFGQALNPLDTSRSAGGGSCGEACALALNISVIGVGADVVGGARIPAHFCGLAALRPTAHRVSTQGLIQGRGEVPACVSPMSRSVSGLVAFMRAVCGQNKNDPDLSLPFPYFDENVFEDTTPLRIGYYTEDNCTKTTPPVHRAIFEAKKILERNGHKLVEFQPPDMKNMLTTLLYPAVMSSSRILWNLLSQDIVDASNREFYYRARLANPLRWLVAWLRHAHSDMEGSLESAAFPITLSDGWHLSNKIQQYRQNYHGLWKHARLDALVGPVFPCAAVNLANEGRFLACLTHVGQFSLLNHPAGTVPVLRVKNTDLSQFRASRFVAVSPLEQLMTQDQIGDEASQEGSVLGLPIGVQVAALPFHEEVVLRLLKELEEGRHRSSFSEQGRKSSLLSLKPVKPYSNNLSESEMPSDSHSTRYESGQNRDSPANPSPRLPEDQDNQPGAGKRPQRQTDTDGSAQPNHSTNFETNEEKPNEGARPDQTGSLPPVSNSEDIVAFTKEQQPQAEKDESFPPQNLPNPHSKKDIRPATLVKNSKTKLSEESKPKQKKPSNSQDSLASQVNKSDFQKQNLVEGMNYQSNGKRKSGQNGRETKYYCTQKSGKFEEDVDIYVDFEIESF